MSSLFPCLHVTIIHSLPLQISKSDVFEEVTSELVVDPNTTKHFCTIMQQHRWIKYTELKCDGIQ